MRGCTPSPPPSKPSPPHHLLIDGRNKPWDIYNRYETFADDPHIDAVSYHTYVNLPEADTPAGTLRLIREQLRGRKPVIVTEVAMYTSLKALRDLLNEIESGGAIGAQWWRLRVHNRDGGFYKHSDRGSKFGDLNWPGFAAATDAPSADATNHERAVLEILHDYAARISARPPVPVTPPEAPSLLPASDVARLSWQGSAGASGYDVQRASTVAGPWTTLASNLDDHLVPYDTLYCDRTADIDSDHFYRVIARNAAGTSEPSNVIGPLRPDRFWIVDDQNDPSQWDATSSNLKVVPTYLHGRNLEAIGVAQRAGPTAPAHLIYRVPGTLRSFRIFTHATAKPPRIYTIDSSGERTAVFPAAQSYQDQRRTRYELELEQTTAAGL
ncbi:MAG: fibronectin type III domain-containing protein [Candidatus Synoicihabitans palmerolidicus]|nr:fibronectin type III domain-containing protein [Candidatus Synoicihabitans palmerolidicus]